MELGPRLQAFAKVHAYSLILVIYLSSSSGGHKASTVVRELSLVFARSFLAGRALRHAYRSYR